jgi:RNA polymerase sigma factor (TIGR02999 family)
MEDPVSKVAHLLNELEGNEEAAPQLFELLYDDLRRMARHHLQRERPDHTLQATALVHEAYVRLAHANKRLETRGHFFVIASSAMRRVLVDHARARKAAKRPGSRQKVDLADAPLLVREQYDDILTLNHALDQLKEVDERLCRIVELRYFGGLTAEETAGALGISAITVHRDWAVAKAWLSAELRKRPAGA